MDAGEIVQERPAGARAQKPHQIREAAARLFIEQGYGAVSMDAIAREAGVSKATIYAHFPDKAALFGSLMAEECTRQSPALATLETDDGEPREILLTLARAYAELLASPRAIAAFRMVISESPRFPELGRAFFENGPKRVTDRLAAYLARAEAHGKLTFGDVRLAAQQFLALVRCEYHVRTVLGITGAVEPAEIEAVATGATDVFLRAYGK